MPPIASILHPALALVLPPRCPGCGAVVAADHEFCVPCWSSLRFLTPPWCAACQAPFEYDRGAEALCGPCQEQAPRHAGLYAAVAYGDVARTVALRLKYGGRTGLAETAARQMRRWVPADAELLVPVPLHRRRLWGRGFNQAALIAARMARASGVPTDPLALRRTRATPPLRSMSGRQRAKTVAGAFDVDPAQRDAIRNRHIVLIDDVYTSGATTDGCVAVLRRAGAERVTILCWARVLDGD